MGIDFKRAFVTNREKEVSGVKIPIAEGVSITVARFNNPKMEEHLQRLGKPYARSIKAGQFSNTEMRKLMAKAMSHHVLLGWEGFEEDGAPLTYSAENAERLLNQSRDFFDLVFEAANEQQNFREDAIEEASGN